MGVIMMIMRMGGGEGRHLKNSLFEGLGCKLTLRGKTWGEESSTYCINKKQKQKQNDVRGKKEKKMS